LLNRPPATLPLSELSPGLSAILVELRAPRRIALRLAELGLTPSTELRVLCAQRGQPLLLAVRDSRLALDRELADSVMVRVSGEEGFPSRNRHGRGRRR